MATAKRYVYRPLTTGPQFNAQLNETLRDIAADIAALASAFSGGGVTDHGALTGLADNDHPQYALASHNQAWSTITGTPTTLAGYGITDAGYALQVMAANAATTTDSQTIYFGSLAGLAPTTTAAITRIYIPKAGTIKRAYIVANCATAGTAEAWPLYVRLNNTTDTLVESPTVSSTFRTWTNTSLSIAVVAGDYIELKAVNPAWVTNPANVRFGGVIYVE